MPKQAKFEMPTTPDELRVLLCKLAGVPDSTSLEAANRRLMGLPDDATDDQLRDARLAAMGSDIEIYDAAEDDAIEVALDHAMQVTGYDEVLDPGDCPAFDAAFYEAYFPAFWKSFCNRMAAKDDKGVA